MITQKDIVYGTFSALTTKGQDATAWLSEDRSGAAGTVNARIVHSDSGVPDFDDNIALGKRIHMAHHNDDVLVLEADNVNDVFYAACVDVGAKVTISVDAL